MKRIRWQTQMDIDKESPHACLGKVVLSLFTQFKILDKIKT